MVLNFKKKKIIIIYLYACIGVIYLLGFRRKESKDNNTLLDSERRGPTFWAFKFGMRHENLWEE